MLCAASVACGCHIALRGLHLQGRLVAWPGLCLSLTDCGPGVLLSQVGAVFGGLQVILCIVYPSRSVDRYAVCGTAHWGVPALICNCSDLLTQPEADLITSACSSHPSTCPRARHVTGSPFATIHVTTTNVGCYMSCRALRYRCRAAGHSHACVFFCAHRAKAVTPSREDSETGMLYDDTLRSDSR